MKETLEMTKKELERVKIMSQVIRGELSQELAGRMLGISGRQVRNVLTQMKLKGDEGVISKHRGKSSNHRLSDDVKVEALRLIRENYCDYGPTLASEQLKKRHNITVSKETLRLWMIESHLWFAKTRKINLHPPRARRRAFGEMDQIDGSLHAWFEERGLPCVLMVCIDDATGLLTALHFSETESLEAYFAVFEKRLRNYGIPLAIYGDRSSILTPRNPNGNRDRTQFQKALKELNCQLILAWSAQAKGRIERVNRTLQDRLVKELRFRGISTIKEANEMLEEFRQEFNRMFGKKPSEQGNAHRSLDGICLEHVLAIREERILTKDFLIQFRNTFYQISAQDDNVHLYKGGKVEIRQLRNKAMIALFKGKLVKMTPLSQVESPILDEKQILEWKMRKQYIPPPTHPFKHGYHMSKIKEEMFADML